MKKVTVYKIPDNKIQPGAKLNSGDEFSSRMVGAYYGSSFEYNVSIHLQYSSGGQVQCPAEKQLQDICKPKRRHGEFGAEIARENNDVPSSRSELGRAVIELANLDEVRAVRQVYDRIVTIDNKLTEKLQYRESTGNVINYATLRSMAESHKETNRELQCKKDKAISDAGFARKVDANGKRIKQVYSEELLATLGKINESVWSPTGVNLVITYSGLHTIAKDNKFYTGRASQAELDDLASKLDYKEVNSFFKGSLRSANLSVPIQTVKQLKDAISWLKSVEVTLNDNWPKEVRDTAIKLVKSKE